MSHTVIDGLFDKITLSAFRVRKVYNLRGAKMSRFVVQELAAQVCTLDETLAQLEAEVERIEGKV